MLTYILYIVMKEITFTERLKMKVFNEVLAFMANFPNHIFILTVKRGLKSETLKCFLFFFVLGRGRFHANFFELVTAEAVKPSW